MSMGGFYMQVYYLFKFTDFKDGTINEFLVANWMCMQFKQSNMCVSISLSLFFPLNFYFIVIFWSHADTLVFEYMQS